MDAVEGERPVGGARLLIASLLWPVLTVALLVVTGVALRLLAPDWTRAHPADLIAFFLVEAYVALLASLLACFGGPAGLGSTLGFRFTSWGDLGLAWLAWAGAFAAGALLIAALTPLLGKPSSNAVPVLRRSFDPLFVALVVPTLGLLAPLCEELLFRGAFYGWLRRRLSVWVAAPLSAAVFAGVHLLPPLFPFFFAFGIAAAVIRERSGSTLNTFAMHATQNLLATAAAYAVISSGRAGG
jgi:membrane protease YdiL (CAAX protease family)